MNHHKTSETQDTSGTSDELIDAAWSNFLQGSALMLGLVGLFGLMNKDEDWIAPHWYLVMLISGLALCYCAHINNRLQEIRRELRKLAAAKSAKHNEKKSS